MLIQRGNFINKHQGSTSCLTLLLRMLLPQSFHFIMDADIEIHRARTMRRKRVERPVLLSGSHCRTSLT